MTAFTAAITMAAGSILLGAGPAAAAVTVSQAQGRFLSGSVGATTLDDIAELVAASAVNDGTMPVVVDSHPLSATVLNGITADLGSGLNLVGPNGLITLGAVNQFASASDDGSSKAASGAVDNNGAIAVGGQNGVPASDATVDLTKLLGSSVGPGLSVLSAGTLQVGAVSATANETAGGVQSGTYQIADLKLNLTSPLITNLTSSLDTLDTANLTNQLRLLGGLGGLGLGTTFLDVPDLSTLVADIGTITTLDGSITVNLSTGAVTIDVAAVLAAAGLDINDLPPNTEILPYVVDALSTQLLPAITTAVNGLTAQITTKINAITATTILGPVTSLVLSPVLTALTTSITTPLNTALSGAGSTVTDPIGDALDGLLSLTGNVQSKTAGKFTETALRLTLVPGTTPVALVSLASASVGANAPLPVPTALSLNPKQGPFTGGTSVTVTGSGFVPGATSVLIGGNTVPAGSVTVNQAGTTATFSTPAHSAQTVPVTLTTPGGTTAPLSFTYLPGSPTTMSLNPTSGPTQGGTQVTVTGSGFVAGQTSVTIGGIVVPAASVTVNNATSLTFTTPAHPVGPVSVTVTTPNGVTSPPLSFFYNAASCVLTGGNAATVTVTASVGANAALVPGNFSVTVSGSPVGTSTPVIPAANGVVQAQASVSVPAGTTTVSYTVKANNNSYNLVGGPVTCTLLTPVQRDAGIYFPLQSARLLDTRKSVPLNPGATYTLQVLGKGGIPATKVASLVANVTVTEPVTSGFLTVYPDGSRPNTSSVNFAPGQTVANLMTAPVGADGKIRIYNGSTGKTHVLVDVSGYFSSGDTVAPGSYKRLDPIRILDTNRSIGVPTSTPVPSNGIITLKVTGVGGVQATNVSAVALNMTVDQTKKIGFVTVYKSGNAPNISSLNFLPGQTNANLVIAPVAPDGTIKIKNVSSGTVRLIADVSGYFLGGIPVLKGEFVAVTPSRILDTRRANQPVQALATITPKMVGMNGIPATGASAVILNVTVDHTKGIGYITVFPFDPRPTASNLNFVANEARPNSVIAPLGSDGKVRMFNGSRRTVDLIADVSGYFLSRPLV